jgi:hypothetical protein
VAESERDLRGILDDLQDTYYRTDQQRHHHPCLALGGTVAGLHGEEMLGRQAGRFLLLARRP